MNHKKYYRDIDRYHEAVRQQKARYRQRTGSAEGPKVDPHTTRRYTQLEDEAILAHDMSDRELAKELSRSVIAIQCRRYKLKNRAARQK